MITAQDLSIPSLPEEACLSFTEVLGEPIGWMPGIKTDLKGVGHYLVRGDSWDMKRYFKVGGKSKSCIAHYLSDDKLVSPFWRPNIFQRRVTFLQSMSITTIVTPDFSTWLQHPIIEQFHAVFKTAVVSRDLGRVGFRIVPQIKAGLPEHFEVYNGWLPDSFPGPILVDIAHLANVELNKRIFWDFAKRLISRWPNTTVWLWSRTEAYVREWQARIGPCIWVPTRCYMQDRVIKSRKKLQKRGD